MKTCTKCLTTKPLFMFYKLSTSKDGLYKYCKPCKNESNSKYRQASAKINKDNFLSKLSSIPQISLPDIDYE